MWWTTYNKNTGQLDAHLFDAQKPKQELSEECDVVEGRYNPDKFFVKQERIIERPKFPIPTEYTVKAGESLRIERIPQGTLVKHDQGKEEVTQDYVKWAAEQPGEYALTLDKFPYQSSLITVKVTEEA